MAQLLIVDDHELVRRTLCGLVRALGYRCHCVGTKAEALKLLTHGSHALVVTDVKLPDGRGNDVAKRAEELGITAILMSGHPAEIAPLGDGKSVNLVKPFGMEEFARILRENLPLPE